MRDRRGMPRTCLAKGKGEGAHSNRLLCTPMRTQKENPGPPGAACWVKKPVLDEKGNSQNQRLPLEMESDLRGFRLSLHAGDKVFPRLKESVRRNSASTAAWSQTVDLFAPAEEHFAGVSCGVQEALGRAWLGGGPGPTDSHRGQHYKGEPRGSGLRRHQEQSEMEIAEDEPPSAFLEGRASELDPACLHSVLGALLHLHPEVSPSDEAECVSPGHSEPMVSEQTVEYKEILPGVKSTSTHLWRTLWSLALHALQVAKPLCHS